MCLVRGVEMSETRLMTVLHRALDRRHPKSVALRLGTILLGAMAAGYAVVAWHIVLVARIGPVAAVVDSAGGRGIHTGDLLALPVGAAGLASLLGAVWTFHLAEERRHAVGARAHRS